MLKMYKSKHYDKKYLNSTSKKEISLSPNTSELEEMFMLQTSYRNKIYYSDRKVRVYLVNLLGII